jgi:hypothetical protein
MGGAAAGGMGMAGMTPPAPGGAQVGAKGNPLGPKQIAALAAGGGAPAAPAAPAKAAGGKGSKAPKPLSGRKLIDTQLEGVLRGEKTSFGPDVINNMVSGALQSREAANRTGLDDVNRQLAARGLGRSPLGAGMAADVMRGSRQDYSKNISDIYSQKATQDFQDKMGAINPYMAQIAAKEANARAAAQMAEQKRQFDISQQNRGGGGGGPSEDDQLLQILMGME